MIAKITTNGANWINVSIDPSGDAPVAWAKAGEINKGMLRRRAETRGRRKRGSYSRGWSESNGGPAMRGPLGVLAARVTQGFAGAGG
jgi:hypothetical protein